MIYCDLSIDDVVIFAGVACMWNTTINTGVTALPGTLLFTDTQGMLDPYYQGFGVRFDLAFLGDDAEDALFIPLDPIPSQQFDIPLGGKNCTLSFYEK